MLLYAVQVAKYMQNFFASPSCLKYVFVYTSLLAPLILSLVQLTAWYSAMLFGQLKVQYVGIFLISLVYVKCII